MWTWLKKQIVTRAFWATVVGLALPPLNKLTGLDIPSEQVIAALVVLGTYIAKAAYEDGVKTKAAAAVQVAMAAQPAAPASVTNVTQVSP